MTRVITFGTFDLLHYGHVRLLKRAAELGDELIVGVSTDDLTIKKKNQAPYFDLEIRKEMLLALKYVDNVFTEHRLEDKAEYIQKYSADILVMGDDWKGHFDHLSTITTKVQYLNRTPNISSSEIRLALQT